MEIFNWARTFSCRPKLYVEPKSIESLQDILIDVNNNKRKVRVFGCGHSPSSLSMSNDVLISMKYFNKIIQIDQINEEIHCESGVLISTLNEYLPQYNLSLPVQGSVSHLTIGGVISTATHGSGIQFGTLSSFVRSITIMKLDGHIQEYSLDNSENENEKDLFHCLTCSLGTFGIILNVRLKLTKLFYLELNQHSLEFDRFLNNISVYIHSSDHFRYMWYPHTNGGIAYHLKRIQPIDHKSEKRSNIFSWFRNVFVGYHLLEFLFYISLWFPRFIRWINRIYLRLDGKSQKKIDRCDKLFNFDCLFRQYASEWSIPIDQSVCCLVELDQIIEQFNENVHFPIEIRFSKSENNSYLSPAYQRDSCWINIVSYRPYGHNHQQHRNFFQLFEKTCLKYDGRPHWAKEHPLDHQQIEKLYPKWNLFHQYRREFDPNNLFLNPLLEKLFL